GALALVILKLALPAHHAARAFHGLKIADLAGSFGNSVKPAFAEGVRVADLPAQIIADVESAAEGAPHVRHAISPTIPCGRCRPRRQWRPEACCPRSSLALRRRRDSHSRAHAPWRAGWR